MKKFLLIIFAVLMSVMPGFALDKYTIDRNELPNEAQEFLTTHFPNQKVSLVKVDKHLLKKTDYDVKLLNGTKIDFSNAGKWTCVDCGKNAVPDAILPSAVKKYVTQNHPDLKVVKIEKTTLKYVVYLSDGSELNFNLLGQIKK